jgi:hypothetical protein
MSRPVALWLRLITSRLGPRPWVLGLWFVGAVTFTPGLASGQDMVGVRVFPEQLVVREAFVETTLTLPDLLHIRQPAGAPPFPGQETALGTELKLQLTENLGLSLLGTLTHLDPDHGPSQTGFENFVAGLTYQVLRSERHELLGSIGLDWEVGGTGRSAVGAQSHSALTPNVVVAKGLGDLPAAADWLKPLAVVTALGGRLPIESSPGGSRDADPRAIAWGMVVQYSLGYLETQVQHREPSAVFGRLFPVLELDFQTPVEGRRRGQTVGTINPGFVWVGRLLQVGLEAALPANERTGSNVGVRFLLRFSLDELIPRLRGPLFGQPKRD